VLRRGNLTVATITQNTAETIEFTEVRPNVPTSDLPFLLVQLGDWDLNGKSESGIIIDSSGPEILPTVLSANNARKLAKWLNRAADQLDETQNVKTPKKRQHYEQDDEENYGLRLDK